MTKHTPGPWRINAHCPFAQHGQISIESDDYYIALLDAGARQLSHARLIAAAPDLLEALRGLLAAVQHSVCENSGPAQDAARAAIKKAIGEAA